MVHTSSTMIWGVPEVFSCLVVKGLLEIQFKKESTLVLQQIMCIGARVNHNVVVVIGGRAACTRTFMNYSCED